MNRTIIGICGYKGSGKTTAAQALIEIGFTRVRFAETLKNMLKCLGLTDAELDGDLKEVPCVALNGVTPRRAMQTLGTEWGRNLICNDLWIADWERRVDDVAVHSGHIVVDDMRFPNEVEAIRGMGGKIIMVSRTGIVGGGSHDSEDLSHIKADYTIYNTSDIESVRAQARHYASF